MQQVLLFNARVVLANEIRLGGVLVRDGRIAQIFASDQKPAGLSANETVDLDGAYLSPGLIDIHIHGSAGVDVQAAGEADLTKLSEFLLAEGVTGYFATFVPTDERGYRDAIASIGSYVEKQDDAAGANRGARILGIHFEGPFVSEHRCGALQTEHFRSYDGDPRSIEVFTSNPRNTQASLTRLMTLAPEIHGGLDLTRELTRRGVRVFIGHSQADPDVLHQAARAGARHITHFPNALQPLHHRQPGAVAWGLVQSDVTLDCIADFHHVHPLMLRLIYQSKGADGMALISDAIMPAGLGDGEFSVWGEKITVRNGRTSLARGAAEDTIAGSVITMREALKNIIGLGVPVHEAVRMATLGPARVAGIDSDCGSIEVGKRADLIVFDDDLTVRFAAVQGRLAGA
ncbi:MAG TPA: N-acetylglucosamine-6-phosphate deacetylase [Blastocatellia bacterium]|nr:N-acetylglucosamine-6-phosphate deacetylase [Blastocatellia bacterium]